MDAMNSWRGAFVTLTGLLLALAAGCASLERGAAEEVVRERAQARWNALVRRDWNTAYPYLTPAYRAVVPLQRYGNQFTGGPVQWEGARVDSVACEEKRCSVRVEVTVRILLKDHMASLSSTFVDEVWILEEDGHWYKFETV